MAYGDNRYGGGDNRYGGGGDRWRGERDERSGRWDRERGSYGSWGSERDRDRGDGVRGRDDDDRGFMDRAGDQVRSWFGDDDAQRRRDIDERHREREHRMSGDRDDDWRDRQSFGGGFGNQRGWREERGWGGDRDDHHNERRSGRDRYATFDSDYGGGGGGAEPWGGSGFGGGSNTGRRFDRIDPGHVGAQGAHPMSAPVGGGYGGGYGASAGGYGSSSRSRAILRNADRDEERSNMGSRPSYGSGDHDPHYSEWRQRQIQQLDRDYEDYRREHQSRFESDFGGWREKRQTQRQYLSRVTPDMMVVGSDGENIGTVDRVRDDRIMLAESDADSGGGRHSIPCSWIERVDDKVIVNKSAQEAMSSWKNESYSRALFEREDQGQGGPHQLNRSFSGTYNDRDDK